MDVEREKNGTVQFIGAFKCAIVNAPSASYNAGCFQAQAYREISRATTREEQPAIFYEKTRLRRGVPSSRLIRGKILITFFRPDFEIYIPCVINIARSGANSHSRDIIHVTIFTSPTDELPFTSGLSQLHNWGFFIDRCFVSSLSAFL